MLGIPGTSPVQVVVSILADISLQSPGRMLQVDLTLPSRDLESSWRCHPELTLPSPYADDCSSPRCSSSLYPGELLPQDLGYPGEGCDLLFRVNNGRLTPPSLF